MLGKSGTYYRAGYLARQANDWPDGTDEQDEEAQDDVPVQMGSNPGSLQQDSSAVPVMQYSASSESPQFFGASPFQPTSMSIFAPPMQSPRSVSASQAQDPGWQTTGDEGRMSPVSVFSPMNRQEAQAGRPSGLFGVPQLFDGNVQRRSSSFSLLSGGRTPFGPPLAGNQVNTSQGQQRRVDSFNRLPASSSQLLPYMGSPDVWPYQATASPGLSPADPDGDPLTLSSVPNLNASRNSDQNFSQQGTAIRAGQRAQSVSGGSSMPSSYQGGLNNQAQSRVAPQAQPRPLTPISLAAIQQSPMTPGQKAAFTKAVMAAAQGHNLDPNLLVGLAHLESHFKLDQPSPNRRARGLFQILPARQQDLEVSDATIKSPDAIVEPVAKYLRQSLDGFHGNVDLTIGSWNQGVSGINKVNRKGGMDAVRNLVIYTDPNTGDRKIMGRDYIDPIKSYMR